VSSHSSCANEYQFFKIKIGWFFAEIWRYNDFYNGGRPPSWICCEVIVSHQRIHFHGPNTVLNCRLDWFCSFWDTCNIGSLSLQSDIFNTRRRHVTISRQPDGRPPQPVRPWKSGRVLWRVHLAEGSNVVVLELPYSTEFGWENRKFASGVRKYGKFDDGRWQTDELQASSVGRRECSSTRERTGARRMDVHVDAYSQPCPWHRRRAVATAQAHVMEVSQGSGVCAALCIRRTLCRHVTIGTPMVIFCCLTVFWLFLTVFDEWYTVPIVKNTQNHWCTNRYRSTKTVPTVQQ